MEFSQDSDHSTAKNWLLLLAVNGLCLLSSWFGTVFNYPVTNKNKTGWMDGYWFDSLSTKGLVQYSMNLL